MTRMRDLTIAAGGAVIAFILASVLLTGWPEGLRARLSHPNIYGGDGLYIMDMRTGQVAVFTYDPASRGVRARKVRNVADAFMTR